jgi:hypothetical protein
MSAARDGRLPGICTRVGPCSYRLALGYRRRAHVFYFTVDVGPYRGFVSSQYKQERRSLQ